VIASSNRRVKPTVAEAWGRLPDDTAAVTALLGRLLHHAHVLKCVPRSWLTKVHTDLTLRSEGCRTRTSGSLDAG
jgi:hypothetical protein